MAAILKKVIDAFAMNFYIGCFRDMADKNRKNSRSLRFLLSGPIPRELEPPIADVLSTTCVIDGSCLSISYPHQRIEK